MNIEIQAIPALKDNYIWLIVNRSDNTAICVDPGEAQPVVDALQKSHLRLTAIVVTHHHWDHTDGILELSKHSLCSVYGSHRENVSGVTHLVQQGDELQLHGHSFQVIEIPGHTLGHICFYGDKKLFCGDTLFTAGCGRVFEGTTKQMYQSLSLLNQLPDDTQIYCAHEYTVQNLEFAAVLEPNNSMIQQRILEASHLRQQNLPTVPSTLKLEKQTNPFLRCDHPDVMRAASLHAGCNITDPVEVFAEIRSWKDRW